MRICEKTSSNHLKRASKEVLRRPPSCLRQQLLAREAALVRVRQRSGMRRPGVDVMQHTVT